MFGVVFSRFLAIIFAVCVLSTPGLAQVAPPPLEAYGDLPAVEHAVISPSGNRIGLLTTIEGARLILVLDRERKPVRSFRVGDVKVRGFEFINDDFLLMQRSATQDLGYGFAQDKFEFYQAFILGIADGSAEMVFGNQGKLVDAVFGYHGIRMVKGKPTAFFGAIELARASFNEGYVFDHGRPALYAVDLLDNRAERADHAPREASNRDWLIGPDGTVIARLDTSKNTGKWSIEGTEGEIASGESPTGGAYLVAMTHDGDKIIYGIRDRELGTNTWYEVPYDGSGEPVEFLAGQNWERTYRDRRTGQVIGYLPEGANMDPVFFDQALTRKTRNVRRTFADYNTRMVDWTPDFNDVIVRIDGNQESGTYLTVDLAARKADAIAFERPLITPQQVGPISTVEYVAGDGLAMDGILTLPPGRESTNLPVVMLPHGGPGGHDVEGFDWWAQAFASRGYAVFQPNFRGSTNRGIDFVQAGYGEWGGKMQSDISDGLAALAEQGIVDPSRACIVGASYGGYAALAGVTLQQGLYRCAVSVNGVSDVSLMARVERRESGDSRTYARSLDQQLGPRSRYREISPRHSAANADAPILLIHGRDDTVVAYDQSLKMADALKDEGKAYEFVELEGEDHWLSRGSTRMAMLEATLDFVQRHNPAD